MAGLRIGGALGLKIGDLEVPGQRTHVRPMAWRTCVSSPMNGRGRVVDIPAAAMGVVTKVREVRHAVAAAQVIEAR